MDKNIIIDAVHTHFEGQLNGVQENGIEIDDNGQLVVTMQHHNLAFNERLRARVQKFIDQYISVPNDATWLRDEEQTQRFAGQVVTYKTEMVGDEEHDVFVYFDGVHRSSIRAADFIAYRALIAAVYEITL